MGSLPTLCCVGLRRAKWLRYNLLTMNTLLAAIESVLFIANRPLSMKVLAENVWGKCEGEVSKDQEVEQLVAELAERYASSGGGLRIVRQGEMVQMATAADCAEVVQAFLKDETTGELSKTALETLTIIAYRGPLTKAELEQIRGVNCGIILRNLQMRGLVEARGDDKAMTTTYQVTLEFVRHLGVAAIEELPDYETLRSHESLMRATATN